MLPRIWNLSAIKLPQQNSKTVNITSSLGGLSKQQLRCLIPRSPNQKCLRADGRSPTFCRRVNGAAKVAQLGDALAGHQHVGRLHVQVQHIHLVAVDQGFAHLEPNVLDKLYF